MMIRESTMLWIKALQVLLVALAISGVHNFNLENRLPIYKFDKQTNSYFGYSVAIHHEQENDKKW